MGNGLTPGPADIGGRVIVDDGTLARTESPTPGPVGLDSKSGSVKQAKASLSEQIVNYPRSRRGERVGDGQCFTLTDRALRAAGARSAADFGSVTPDADYTWGTSVTLAELQPGDVVQFRNYRYERRVVTERSNETVTEEDEQERPHHTAIVETVDGNGAVTVLEQNAPEGSPVRRSQLFFTSRTVTSGQSTTTISVHGTFWFYRPQAR